MVQPIKTDLIPLLQNLTAALQPFAAYHSVDLQFESSLHAISVSHHPESIIPDLTTLICRIILYTPQDQRVKMEVLWAEKPGNGYLRLCIRNTTGNLTGMHKPMLLDIHQKIDVYPNEGGGTVFEWRFPIEADGGEMGSPEEPGIFHPQLNAPFYSKLRKHLSSHFASLENLEKAAADKGQHEGVFIQKINALLLANLDKEGFDTEALGKALALSRTQLYRRLNSILGFSPARYIWYVRLQKAKELLEIGGHSIGAVALQTGFQDSSHFTRTFRKQFGFNPSEVQGPNIVETPHMASP